MSRLLRILQSELSSRTVLALADQFVISGTRFVATWMIARFCGAEQLGYYALGFSGLILIDLVLQAFVTAPFTIFSQGLSTNRLSRYTGDGLVQSSFIGFFGSIVFAVIGCVAAINDSRILAGVMFVVAVVIPICVLREFARRQCFATDRIGLALGIDILFSIVQLGLMYGLLEMQCLTAVSAHAMTGLACGLSLLIWFIARRDCIVFSTRYLVFRATKHWRFGRWVFVSQAMNQLTWNVVQWVIALSVERGSNGGFYGLPYHRFSFNPFVLGIAGVIYPRLALLKNNEGSRAMRRLVWFATVAIGGVMTSFTLVLLTVGQEVCCFLFTDTAYANVGLLPESWLLPYLAWQ